MQSCPVYMHNTFFSVKESLAGLGHISSLYIHCQVTIRQFQLSVVTGLCQIFPCSISMLFPGVSQAPRSPLQLSWRYEVDLKWKSMKDCSSLLHSPPLTVRWRAATRCTVSCCSLTGELNGQHETQNKRIQPNVIK